MYNISLAVTAPVRATLGQARGPVVDRMFAGAIRDSMDVLLGSKDVPFEWTSEQCWINLKIRRWEEIVELYDRIGEFLATSAPRMSITESEETLIGDVLTCVDTLLVKMTKRGDDAMKGLSTVIGVVGGIITVAAVL